MSDLIHSPRLRAEPQPTARIGKSERTRAAILDAAFRFLWSRPFREMTVNSLMATTDHSRSAFYQYFSDVHELMESLVAILEGEILEIADPWLYGAGDPVALLEETLGELVRVCYQRGPFLKAVSDAATADKRVEAAWSQFLGRFDDAVTARIDADQELGLIEPFEPRSLAIALNRLDAYTFIEAFGQRPRGRPEPVQQAVKRLWVSALYPPKLREKAPTTLARAHATDPEALAARLQQ
ncbi:MAG: TetR/AcrR family transcriptional regulator [Gammaproteobacteria bacterium]|nr:TetR/AcrR family transcriptional regulator [Gammaproteobacteria bacterium]NNJ77841.1 TetR/AcrR family transcriptional regulator [Xanthomonadales bacterium]